MNSTHPSHIVGIGASAGGLEVLQTFFSQLNPETNFAFVVIQHLSSDHESMMNELLSRHTSLPITVVNKAVPLMANHVYLISSQHNVVAAEGRLSPSPKEQKPTINLPIDTFFQSLAEAYQDRAIGIVLSGSGTDGSRGVKHIKEHGGMVMVQTPNTAKFDGMPRATATAVSVDFNLPVADLVREVNRLASSEPAPSDGDQLADDRILNTILSLVYDRVGNDFRQHRAPTLLRRIDKRMKIVDCPTLQDYYRFLKEHDPEVQLLAEEFSIAVSSFFRDPAVWEVFRKEVVPELFAGKKRSGPVRIWVPACSTGEEAYTIAILLSEHQEKHQPIDFKIFASDIDKKALARAGAGVFSESISHEMSPFFLEKYFEKTPQQGYRAKKNIRERIVFSVHNLISDPSFIRMDLISCRNVLIYIKSEVQQRILENFHYALNYQAYLVLGANENLGGVREAFRLVAPRSNIFQNVQHEKFDRYASTPSLSSGRRPNRRIHVRSEPPAGKKKSSRDEYAAVMVREHAPTTVFIDREFTLLYVYGSVEQLLKFPQKEVRLNLLDMVDSEERLLIRSGVRKAQEQQSSVYYENVSFGQGSRKQALNLRFKEVRVEQQPQSAVLIEFVPVKQPTETPLLLNHDRIINEQIELLEEEVEQKTVQLQSLSEQLESSNEELQASNEELQASNEELQSSNEELQSVNEELHTVNAELKQKIEEATASRNDMSNLLTSTDIATIFLDENLIVRMITPRSEEIVNIRQKDIGRSFTSFTTQLKRDTLESVIRKVQETGKPVRREVTTRSGKHYFNQVLPYRVDDDATQGVVVTFVDISDSKKARAARLSAERKTREAMRRLEMVIESLKVGIWEWVPRSDQADWNQHMRGLFDISADEFDGKFATCFARIHADDQARVREAFQEAAASESMLNIEFRVLWKDRSVHYIYAQGRMVTAPSPRMVGTCVDLTQRKMAEEAALQYGQLLENSHNEIYICDARTLRFINVNRGARENIGYTLEEMSALTLLDVAPEVSRQQFQDLTQTLDEQPEENIQLETTYQRRDGSHYHVLANLQQMQYNGRPVFILIVLDITEQAIFNAQLQETNRQLKIANEYLDNFVFMAAHDLRAPVANLLSLVQLLEDSKPEDTRIVSRIGISVERLESTLSGLIKILNIQQYGQDEASKLTVEEVYHTIINRLDPQIQEASAQLVTDFSPATFYYIAPYLESILYNLLSNALKYRSEDRPLRVEVRTRTEEDYLLLTVADNGSGIDLERYHEKLFKPFERLTRQATGQGIGMHLVKTMVEKNGGYIKVESTPNQGTTFHIYLHTYEQKRHYATNSVH
ncbi:MAG: CheR family methyltransferase [Tunicatimonas sp.]